MTIMDDNVLKDINIQHFKLVNGEEFIGLVRGTENNRILIEFPLMLNVMSLGAGKESFYFTEWMPMARDEVIHVYPTTIITHSEVTDQFKEHYIRTALKFKEKPNTVYGADEDDIYDEMFDNDDEDFDNVVSINKTIH